MTDTDLRASLKRVATTLKDADVRFMLGGGYATWARGGPEPEHDVDFFVREQDADEVLAILEGAGFRPERPAEDWLVKVYDGDNLIDLIHHPVNRPVTDEMLDRADELSVDSVYMPVMSATDILVGKLLALGEQDCDMTSALDTSRSLREQIDWARVRQEAGETAYAAAFLVLVERLGIVEPAP